MAGVSAAAGLGLRPADVPKAVGVDIERRKPKEMDAKGVAEKPMGGRLALK